MPIVVLVFRTMGITEGCIRSKAIGLEETWKQEHLEEKLNDSIVFCMEMRGLVSGIDAFFPPRSSSVKLVFSGLIGEGFGYYYERIEAENRFLQLASKALGAYNKKDFASQKIKITNDILKGWRSMEEVDKEILIGGLFSTKYYPSYDIEERRLKLAFETDPKLKGKIYRVYCLWETLDGVIYKNDIERLMAGTIVGEKERCATEKALDLYIKCNGKVTSKGLEKSEKEFVPEAKELGKWYILHRETQEIFSWYMNMGRWDDAIRFAEKTLNAFGVLDRVDYDARIIQANISSWQWINDNFKTLKKDFVFVKTGKRADSKGRS